MGEHDFTHCQGATIKHTQVTRRKGSGDPAKITTPDKPQRGIAALEESQLHKPLHEQQTASHSLPQDVLQQLQRSA